MIGLSVDTLCVDGYVLSAGVSFQLGPAVGEGGLPTILGMFEVRDFIIGVSFFFGLVFCDLIVVSDTV